MRVSSGTQFGHYEVLGHIGSGGMGEVYRAKDTKLGREVAIKVLPEAFARDSDRLARFRREAHLLASLNHPNIAAIYGLEVSNSTHFLVLELVPGEDLRERLVREGPVPLEEVLGIATQIAEALEHAHEKGVIHRDLKPANVKVTPEGKVKVLDFGLAKAFAAEPSETDIHNAPTASGSPTIPGVILGTAAYMSPEQARGKQVDKRTDLWALGCVLYELLTGKPAFAGESVTDILGAVLHKEPDWASLPAETPQSVRLLLRRCLQKDVKERFRDAADVAIQMKEAQHAPAVPTTAVAPQKAPFWRRLLPWAVAAVFAVVASIAVWNLKPSPSPPSQPVSRFAIALPPNERLANLESPAVAISPDGTQLAYVASRDGGGPQIYLRAIDALEGNPVPGTQDGHAPSFSPDGKWLLFFAEAKLKKVQIPGGSPISLSDAPGNVATASWGLNDNIALGTRAFPTLLQVPAAGGKLQAFTWLDGKRGDTAHRFPEFLPDGKAVLFAIAAGMGNAGWDAAKIVVQRLDTGEQRILVEGGTAPHYSPTGHLLFVRAGIVMAAPFDLKRLEVTGTSVPILDGVTEYPSLGSAQFSISQTGILAYVPGAFQGDDRKLVWVDRKGLVQPLAAPPGTYEGPRLSPDGKRVAVINKINVWTYDISRDTLTRLTFDPSNGIAVGWTPDGKRITYSLSSGGPANLFWKPADGSGPEEWLAHSEYVQTSPSFSPDGKTLAFYEVNPGSGRDIWVMPLDGDRKPRLFLRTEFSEGGAVFSPDGHWLAYASNESGRSEIYVQPYPGPGGK
ncbi:MAG: serine/threonine-protein kinase [Acidobacteria bacterium]|nr:serine/threonine-protein kinase [Acidobacteriota bacterium]